jgi:hypothetical protein
MFFWRSYESSNFSTKLTTKLFTNYLLNAYQMAFASYPCQKGVLNALRQIFFEHPMIWSCNTKMGYYK